MDSKFKMIKNVSQIFISDSNEPLSPLLKESTETVKACFNGYKYNLYNSENLQDLIKEGIGDEALIAYNTLNAYACKADLGRYCIAYLIGGWYVDISIKMIRTITFANEVDFLGFIDLGAGAFIPNCTSYPVQCSLFYSKPKSPIFAKAIDLVIENCKAKNYGVSPVCVTATGVLGRALAHVGAQKNHMIGHFIALTPNHKQKNRSYVLPSGDILAIHKDTWFPSCEGGEIASLGALGTNNYHKMYEERTIYK
tara:strand:+ start:744 stop:1502 length:759 start_codon:yes stop_codon:yes gene_type:complete